MSPLDYLGVRIPTIVEDNVSIRCDGCLEVIAGTPWRMNILDIVAAETPVSWAMRPPLNPGPFEFHGDGGARPDVDAVEGLPVLSQGRGPRDHAADPDPRPRRGPARYGLCDGIHRDDHELVPA